MILRISGLRIIMVFIFSTKMSDTRSVWHYSSDRIETKMHLFVFFLYQFQFDGVFLYNV